jgi:hypothetical protein
MPEGLWKKKHITRGEREKGKCQQGQGLDDVRLKGICT